VPIHATEAVLTEAGVLVDDDESGEESSAGVPDEEEVDRFRAFLDNVSPEDFGRGA
jgi:hypothetical protein